MPNCSATKFSASLYVHGLVSLTIGAKMSFAGGGKGDVDVARMYYAENEQPLSFVGSSAVLLKDSQFGDNRLRWTSLYIHDTDKQTRLGIGQRHQSDADFLQQRTAWFERQLIDTQLVGEFEFSDLSIDARAAYARTQRDAPGELYFEYVRTNSPSDPFGDLYVNLLNGNRGTDMLPGTPVAAPQTEATAS